MQTCYLYIHLASNALNRKMSSNLRIEGEEKKLISEVSNKTSSSVTEFMTEVRAVNIG